MEKILIVCNCVLNRLQATLVADGQCRLSCYIIAI